MTLSTVAHDTFVVERTYDVPVALVFRAWADPVFKARWFAGSADALEAGYELDFRVGGGEVNRAGPPGGPVYTYESQFHDIVPEQRIVYTYEMSADDDRLSVSVATVEFHNHDATTHPVSYTHLDVYKRQAPCRPSCRRRSPPVAVAGGRCRFADRGSQRIRISSPSSGPPLMMTGDWGSDGWVAQHRPCSAMSRTCRKGPGRCARSDPRPTSIGRMM